MSDDFSLRSTSSKTFDGRPEGQHDESLSERIAAIQRELANSIGPHRFQQWFDRTLWQVRDETLTVSLAHQILLGWVQKQYKASLEQIASRHFQRSMSVEFVVDVAISTRPGTIGQPTIENVVPCDPSLFPRNAQLKMTENVAESASGAKPHKASPSGVPAAPSLRTNSAQEPAHLPAKVAVPKSLSSSGSSSQPAGPASQPRRPRRRFTFDEFIVGECNRLAYTTAHSIVSHPLEDFSTLYLCGNIGTGKTALFQAIYHEITARHPQLKVLCLTAEEFGNQYSMALQSKTIASFRSKFRQIDILMIDDIDFLAGKPNFQQELLNTIRTLEHRGLKLIVTADRHPKLMTNFSEELCNRLVSGVFTRLQAPDLPTLRLMAKSMCAKLNVDFPEPVIEFVSRKFHRSFRELQGAINSLHAHTLMQGTPMNLAAARQILAELLRDSTRIIRMSDIEQAVAEMFGIEIETLKSSSRARHVCHARMIAMYLSRHLVKASLNEIGIHFGGRNHSTVHTAERKVREWIKRKEQFPISTQLWNITDLLASLEQQLVAI